MKKKQMQDERVVAQQHKIQSNGFTLLIWCLLISIIIQQFLMQAPLSQFIGEFICMISASLYVVVHNLLAGNSLYPASKKQNLRNSIIGAIVACLILVVLQGVTSPMQIFIQFICFIASFCGLMFLCQWIASRRQTQLIRQLEESEDQAQ